MNHIYLDANATTQIDEKVRDAMVAAYQCGDANPASQHRPGQLARRKLENLRAEIASYMGASRDDRLIFTSGGTESDNLAIIGLAGRLLPENHEETPEVIVSAIEHPAVLGAADFLASQGFRIRRLPANKDGVVNLECLREMISPATRLVSLMLGNNETGVIQDVRTAVDLCSELSIPVHCDAVQAIGKLAVSFTDLGVDAMTVTAHKIHGPCGIGALLVSKRVELLPIMFGGTQQLGQRPGTEDLALATGFAKSIELACENLDSRIAWIRTCRDRFEDLILQDLPDTLIHGRSVPRLPHTSNLSFTDGLGGYIDRQALMMAADHDLVAISTGSACASGSSEPSHVLTAMGCPDDVVGGSIRASFSVQTTEMDVGLGARRIINCVKRLRQQKSQRK